MSSFVHTNWTKIFLFSRMNQRMIFKVFSGFSRITTAWFLTFVRSFLSVRPHMTDQATVFHWCVITEGAFVSFVVQMNFFYEDLDFQLEKILSHNIHRCEFAFFSLWLHSSSSPLLLQGLSCLWGGTNWPNSKTQIECLVSISVCTYRVNFVLLQ